MAELQRAYQQARNDLVAHAQHQRRVEHVVRKRYRRAHGDDVPAEQAELHAAGALGHAVAHRRHAAGHLGRGAQLAGFVLDEGRVSLQRRVRRQHVVVGGDDADVGRALRHDLEAVIERHARKGMSHVGTAHAVHAGVARGGGMQLGEVGVTCGTAARGDAGRDV
jgi:hypothetical protein